MATLPYSDYTVERRSTLYYNKFQYKIQFVLTGAGRTYNIYDMQRYIVRIEQHRRSDSWRPLISETINLEAIDRLLEFKVEYSKAANQDNRVLVTTDYWTDKVKIYTNSIEMIETIRSTFHDVDPISVCAATVQPELANTIFFSRQPPYNFRVYFRDKLITSEYKQSLVDFCNMYSEVDASRTLKRWLKGNVSPWRNHRMQRSHYIQFNDEGMFTIINLYMNTDTIGKTYVLKQRQ